MGFCWDGIFQIKNMLGSPKNDVCTIKEPLQSKAICMAVVIWIIPGSRIAAAASNLWLFRMSTSSPTVQLLVPQSASSSSVGLLPCATRPANLLQTNS